MLAIGNGIGVGFPASGYGGLTTINPLRVISIHNRLPNVTDSSTGKTRHADRWPCIVATDASEARFVFNNWRLTIAPTEEMPTGNAVTILSCCLEDEKATVSVPVYFNGSRSYVMADGESNVVSDAILPSSFSLDKFSKNEYYYVKFILEVPASGNPIPQTQHIVGDYPGSQANWYDPAVTTVSDIDTLGAFTYTGTAWTTRISGYCPIMIGRPIVDGPSFLGLGDSIMEQSADSSTAGPQGRGFFQRAMHRADFAEPVPSINIAKNGSSTTTPNNSTKWHALLPYVRYVVDEYGTNNFGVSAIDSERTALQTALETMWGVLRTNNISDIIRTYLMPKTSSTSTNWTSAADQTFAPAQGQGFEPGGPVETFHAWIDSKLADNTVNYVEDFPSVRDPGAFYKWLTNGTNDYPTADGVHPTAALHELAASDLRATIAPLLPAYTPPTPLGSVIASTVMDLSASHFFDGQMQTWRNLEPTPADGSAQNAYDFVLGNSTTAGTTDPTFTGTRGSPSAFLLCDGGDYVSIPVNPAFFKNLHKTTGGTDWTFGIFLKYLTGTQYFFSTWNSSTSRDGIGCLVTSNVLSLRQGGNSSNVNTNLGTLTSGTRVGVIVSYRASDGKLLYAINNRTLTEVPVTFVTATNDANHVLSIGSANTSGAVSPFPNGTELDDVFFLNEAIDNTKLGLVYDLYNARHGRTYA